MLALVVSGCRSAPPFAPARFEEPQECAADADCGAGRVCMRFDDYFGPSDPQCVVPCSKANRTCPKHHVCVVNELDRTSAPYCAREGFTDAGGRGFPGATGWDEAFWTDGVATETMS